MRLRTPATRRALARQPASPAGAHRHWRDLWLVMIHGRFAHQSHESVPASELPPCRRVDLLTDRRDIWWCRPWPAWTLAPEAAEEAQAETELLLASFQQSPGSNDQPQ